MVVFINCLAYLEEQFRSTFENGLEQTLFPVGVCLVNQDGEHDLVGYSYTCSLCEDFYKL